MRVGWSLAVALLFCSSVHGDGLYLGGGTGPTEFEVSQTGGGSGDPGWKVFAGWRFNRHAAVELGRADLGNPAGLSDGSIDSLNLFVIGVLPATPRLDLYAKLGAADGSVPATAPEYDPDGVELAGGLGVSWRFTRGFLVQLEWESLGDFGVAGDARMLSLGARWEF